MRDIEGLPLEAISLFRGVAPESLEGILAKCRVIERERQEILLEPQVENQDVYILLSGRLRVHLTEPFSEPVAFIEPGEVAGELSVIDGKPVSAFVVANQPCRLLVLSHDLLWSLVGVSHGAAVNLLEIISGRLRSANSLIVVKTEREYSYHRYGTMDALTGMHNRYWLNGVLPRLISRCAYTCSPLSLLMVDIDLFKSFNDDHGHLSGDQAIHTVARAIMANLRPTELAVRYGGDEFLIILPGVDTAMARGVADRLLKQVAKERIPSSDGNFYPPLTISVGLASAVPGATAEELIAAADNALYRAKREGRNTISL